jgi:hypothetical protein
MKSYILDTLSILPTYCSRVRSTGTPSWRPPKCIKVKSNNGLVSINTVVVWILLRWAAYSKPCSVRGSLYTMSMVSLCSQCLAFRILYGGIICDLVHRDFGNYRPKVKCFDPTRICWSLICRNPVRDGMRDQGESETHDAIHSFAISFSMVYL